MAGRIYAMRMGMAGDCLLSTATLRYIKQKHPEKELIYVTNRPYMTLVSKNPFVDRVANVAHPGPGDIWWEISQEKFKVDDQMFWGEIIARQAASMGLLDLEDMKTFRPEVHIPLRYATRLNAGKFVVIGPWSWNGRLAKVWGIDAAGKVDDGKWPEIVRRLKDCGYQAVNLGLEEEPEIPGCLDYRGRVDLAQAVGLICAAKVIVSIDTFWMHAANANVYTDGVLYRDGTELVAILGPTVEDGLLPTDGKAVVVQNRPDFPECPCWQAVQYGWCKYKNECMQSITVDMVWDALEPLL